MAIGNLLTLDTFQKLQGVNYILKSPKMFVAVNFAFEVTIRHPFRSQVFKAGVFSQHAREVNQILT